MGGDSLGKLHVQLQKVPDVARYISVRWGENFQSVPTDVDGVLYIESICDRIETVSAHKDIRVGLG